MSKRKRRTKRVIARLIAKNWPYNVFIYLTLYKVKDYSAHKSRKEWCRAYSRCAPIVFSLPALYWANRFTGGFYAAVWLPENTARSTNICDSVYCSRAAC